MTTIVWNVDDMFDRASHSRTVVTFFQECDAIAFARERNALESVPCYQVGRDHVFTLTEKRERYRKAGYRFLLHFITRWHDAGGGSLAGLETQDTLPFCTRRDAKGWVDAINRIQRETLEVGGSRNGYRISVYRIEAL